MAQETFLVIQKLDGYYDRCKISRADATVQTTIINGSIIPFSSINLHNDDGSTFNARFIASGDKDSMTALVNSKNNYHLDSSYGPENFQSQPTYTNLNQSQSQPKVQTQTQRGDENNFFHRISRNNEISTEGNHFSGCKNDDLTATIRKIIAQEINKPTNNKAKKATKRNHESIDLTGLDEEQDEDASFPGSFKKKKRKDDLDTNQLGICVDLKYYEMMKSASFVHNGKLLTRPERVTDILSRGYPSAVADLVFSESERYYGFIGQSPRKRHALNEERIEYFKCCLIKGLSDHFSSYNTGYSRFTKLWPNWRENVNQRWRDQHALRDKQRLPPPTFPINSLVKCNKSSCTFCQHNADNEQLNESLSPTPLNHYTNLPTVEPKSPSNYNLEAPVPSTSYQTFLD